MYVLLHLLICTALRAHIIVVETLYKLNYYYCKTYFTHLTPHTRDLMAIPTLAISTAASSAHQ